MLFCIVFRHGNPCYDMLEDLMQKCPNPRCGFKTSKPNRMAHHLEVNPGHQPGKKQKAWKGHKGNAPKAK
jgi:hypothetical protein